MMIFVFFCSPTHPLANKSFLTDGDVLNHQWVLREAGSGTRQAFDRAMHGILPQIKIALELQHTEAIKRAVSYNLGLGCLSRITLEGAFSRGDLIELKMPNRDFNRTLYFILHKKKHQSAGIKRWLEYSKGCD